MALSDFLHAMRAMLPEPRPANPELAATATPDTPRCRRCGLLPEEIEEYRELVVDEDGEPVAEPTPEQCREAMREEEGTYNRETGGFYDTDCYIAVGQPKGKAP